MLRPVVQAKLGRSWLVFVRGGVWRLKRPHRKSPLIVYSFEWRGVGPSVSPRVAGAMRRLEMFKPQAQAVRGTGKLAVDDPLAFKELPGWRAFLLDQTYRDGVTERQAGVVIFKADGSGWQFTLKDPSSCTMLKLTSRTWDEGLLLLESLLGDEKAPWETDAYEAGKRGRSRGRKG